MKPNPGLREIEPDWERGAEEMDPMPTLRELGAEGRRKNAAAADEGITGDADVQLRALFHFQKRRTEAGRAARSWMRKSSTG